MFSKVITLNEKTSSSLSCYIQEVGGSYKFEKRPAILVIPGGGYRVRSQREADPIALYYAANGYQSFVLNYTTIKTGSWPDPLNDYEAAMELIHQNSGEWHIDEERIAIAGFSAGGHLAACGAFMSKHRPKAALLIYPAVLKDILDLCQKGIDEPLDHIDESACPCFVAAVCNDQTVKIENSIALIEKLNEYQIPFESHIYAFGGHGFAGGFEYTNSRKIPQRVADWMPESLSFLEEMMGKLTNRGFEEADIHRGDPYAIYVERSGKQEN